MDQNPHRGARLWRRLRYLFTLTALELRFVVCVAKGEEFDGDPNGGRTGDEINKIGDWERRKIRGGVIAALCAGEVPGLSVPPRRGLRMRGAYVVGRVDLSLAQLSQCPLVFHTCRFEQPVSLYQATTADVAFTSCILPGLRGDDLNSSGSLALRKTHVEGEVRLQDAKISGQLSCSDAHLSNPGGDALNAEDLNTTNFFLRRAQVEGEVRLLHAQISSELVCDDAHLSNRGGDALRADGLNATNVSLRDAKVEGEVRLLHAQIGELYCDGAHLSNRGGYALLADSLDVVNVYLSDAHVEGEVRLRGAQISGERDFDGAHLVNPDGYALYARSCHIAEYLYFRLATRAVGKVDLAYAQVGVLVDKLASWPETFNLVGCSYRALEAKNRDPSQRLKWWLGQSEPFSPDIYNQLAEVYRRYGEEGYARQVAIAREEKRAHQPDLRWLVRAWRCVLGFTVAYGYEPWRALGSLMVLFLVGCVAFMLPPAQAVMVYAPHNTRGPLNAAAPCENYPCFSPPIYTLDTLLPIIDLHQESNWVPATHEPWGLLYEVLTWLLIALGWFLTTAIVARIGSVWRSE